MDGKGIILSVLGVLIALTLVFTFINSGDPNLHSAGLTVLGCVVIAIIIVAIITFAKR